ncbi:hypothetical protein ACFV9C_22025 [Kribbella sp. NPDC059898]|uniref:hypothetical protein n=1 Tax=Kribbella sp. NPDC059898 TaxID=3346995 RepID=UPI00365611BA
MDRLADDVRLRVLELVRTPRDRQVLLAAGLRDADLRRLLRRRVLQHHHGHYIDGRLDEGLARIACAQASHPGSVVSHFSAVRLAGLRSWTDSRRPAAPPTSATWLTRPAATRRNQRRADIVVRRAALEPVDVSRQLWLPVTSPARSVVDLARALPFREAIVTVDHALRSGVSLDDLEGAMERQFQWPGIRRARTTIGFGDPRAESVLESIARSVFAVAGLPGPILQAQFWDGYAWMPERVDFWWPEFRTIGEADGLAKYDSESPAERRRQLRRSYRRDQRLSDRAVELVHFGWEDVLDPRSDVIARLRAAFARGRSRPGDPPIWRSADPHDPTHDLHAA